jgi:hypothetical protein
MHAWPIHSGQNMPASLPTHLTRLATCKIQESRLEKLTARSLTFVATAFYPIVRGVFCWHVPGSCCSLRVMLLACCCSLSWRACTMWRCRSTFSCSLAALIRLIFFVMLRFDAISLNKTQKKLCLVTVFGALYVFDDMSTRAKQIF